MKEPCSLHHNNVIRIGSNEAGSMITMTYLSPIDATAQKPSGILLGSQVKTIIGRDPENDIVLEAPLVSRFQAQDERIGQRYQIKDLHSSNGTFINDQRVNDVNWAKPGDNIRIGPFSVIFVQINGKVVLLSKTCIFIEG